MIPIFKMMLRCLFITILCFQTIAASAQIEGNVTGFVTNQYDQPIYGAQILIHKTQQHFYTDSSGFFNIKDPAGKYDATVSADGYEDYKTIFVFQNETTNIGDTIRLQLKKSPVDEDGRFAKPVYNVNVQSGWRTMGEIALGIGKFDEDFHRGLKQDYSIMRLTTIRVGTEFNFSLLKPLLGPNISYDAMRGPGAYGIGLIYYTDLDKGALFLRPRIGISCNSFCNLMFGFNIPLMKNDMWNRINHFIFSIEVPLVHRW